MDSENSSDESSATKRTKLNDTDQNPGEEGQQTSRFDAAADETSSPAIDLTPAAQALPDVPNVDIDENSSSPLFRLRRPIPRIAQFSEDEDENMNNRTESRETAEDSDSLSHEDSENDSDSVVFSDGQRDSDDDDDSDSDDSERGNPAEGSSSSKPLDGELSFLKNEMPKHKWSACRELHYRQMGLTVPQNSPGRCLQNLSGSMFQKKVCGTLNSVQRLELMFKLQKHRGCVNSLSFHQSGQLLASGSDDLKVILWKWASNEIAVAYESGHTSNVFQAKFFGTHNEIHLITTGRDGQVRHATIPPHGKPFSRALYKHIGAVHKTAVSHSNPTEVFSAGEDAHVMAYDIRTSMAQRLLTVRENSRKYPLYSIATNPINNEFCVCGHDQFVRVYDRRNTKVCARAMCPDKFIGKKKLQVNVTCAVYNYLGTEILATYSDDDIYLFDNKNYEPGKYLHKYTGHSNSSTIKGVNFFGPKSEFIMSGSDCSYIYFWDKESGTIVNWLKGDENGVVNCLEQHPDFPILASSGLDHDVKVWMPSNENPPNLIGLEKKVRRNMQRRKNSRDLECHFDDQIFNLLLNCRQTNIRRRTQHASEEVILSTMDLASDEEEADSTDSDETDRRVSAGVRQIQRVFPCSPS